MSCVNNLNFREIAYQSKEYRQSLALRNRMLRQPLGLNLYDENLEEESRDCHIGAFIGKSLIGILILTHEDDHTVRMRQVAVDTTYQGKGVGSALVTFSEGMAKKMGYTRIILHARETAVPFYRKAGYGSAGDLFFEVGLPHLEMEKKLNINS